MHKTKCLRLGAAAVITVLPLCFGVVFWRLYHADPKAFVALCNEDALVENLQFFFFFATGLMGIWLADRFRRAKDGLNALAYAFFGLLCVFIAMEEISWGQRVFDFGTPDAFKSNIQDEFNLHNLGPIQKLLFLFYTLVGAYACLSGFLWAVPALRRRRRFLFLSVCPCLCFYFLPVVVYGVYRLRLGSWSKMRLHLSHQEARMISIIQEPVELGLAVGFFLIAIAAWLRQRRETKADEYAIAATS